MNIVGRRAGSEEFEQILASAFRQAGLRIKRTRAASDDGPDLEFERDGTNYLVQLKVSSEGRSDRLIPLLSHAILQARAYARTGGDTPIAVVAARHVPASVAGQIQEFAKRYAPEVGVGVIDAEGLRVFTGFGLEAIDAKPARRQDSELSLAPRRARFVFRPQPVDAENPYRAASSGGAHCGAERSCPERISVRQHRRRVCHERIPICEPAVRSAIPAQT
jgi:hypothetical protein